MKKELETNYMRFAVQDDILDIDFIRSYGPITLSIMKEIIASRLYFQDGRDYLVLCKNTGRVEFHWKAIRYLAGPAGITGVKAMAVVMGSPVDYTVTDCIMALSHWPVPVRKFWDENDSRDWLNRLSAAENAA